MWSPVVHSTKNETGPVPRTRFKHASCVDPQRRVVYNKRHFLTKSHRFPRQINFIYFFFSLVFSIRFIYSADALPISPSKISG